MANKEHLKIAKSGASKWNAWRKKNKNIKQIIYWPILEHKEGYWISPFTRRKALQRVLKELENEKTSVMLDLELPTTKNFWLYFTQLLKFRKN